MDLRERRELMNGFGDGLAVAFEFAITPAIFGGLGYLLDRWLGLVPLFTITLFLFGIVGMFLKMWFTYDHRMKAQEAEAVWARKRVPMPKAPTR
ncbi:MAG TPA: AtpZ/AtpI family protein [Acidimicrobiales bacterium]|nr:AtpZ/AtpI family protein [Acidimicrobiales bacterium]